MKEPSGTHTVQPGETVEPANDHRRAKVPMTLHRRSRILDLVRQRGAVQVDELAELFDVSKVTIRSDLAQLEKDGLLIRDRGGAISTSQVSTLLGVEQRAALNLEEKRRIGRAAAQLVSPGDTIIMDAGTTVVEMAPYLAGITDLTVVTNALNVAGEVSAATGARVILLGGAVSRESNSTLGPMAEHSLNELVVQKVFLGTQALDLKLGLTDTSIEIAQIKRAMLGVARQAILLTDSSKWGRAGFIKVAPLTAFQTIVIDTSLPEDAQPAIERLGVEVLLV
jgi:DeoR/GlpR family transcriptional regulator of sugar metabolism